MLCLASPLNRAAAGEPKTWQPQSMAYLLQADAHYKTKAEAVRALTTCDRDLIVIDAAWTGGVPWTAADITAIRAGKAQRKVVAYLSIGEAENYRPYWKKTWGKTKNGKRSAAAPAFLGVENPRWKGNFTVKYWRPDWQAIVLRAVDSIIKQGFDGVYLDIVDAFERFEFDGKKYIDHRKNPATGKTYRADMIAFVSAIAQRARKKAGHGTFRVIPQNGSQLLADKSFRQTISAIGIEDLYAIGDKKQTTEHTKFVLGLITKLHAIKKPILLIEYTERDSLKKKIAARAHTDKVTLLITDRPLKTLGEAPLAAP